MAMTTAELYLGVRIEIAKALQIVTALVEDVLPDHPAPEAGLTLQALLDAQNALEDAKEAWDM